MLKRKPKLLGTKLSKTKLNTNWIDQLLRFLVYYSRNVGKYELLTGEDVLPENDLLGKAGTIKRFKYLPLDSEMKTQTGISKKLYQKFENAS